MPSNCSIFSCPSNYSQSDGSVIFHRFPKDNRVRRKWISACRQQNINPNNARICSLHFKTNEYERNMKYELLRQPVPKNQRRLKAGALPTIQLPASEDHSCTGQMSLGVTTYEEQLIDEPFEIPSVDIASQTTTETVEHKGLEEMNEVVSGLERENELKKEIDDSLEMKSEIEIKEEAFYKEELEEMNQCESHVEWNFENIKGLVKTDVDENHISRGAVGELL